MKLLVIEDDKKTAGYLRKGLTESGFVVDLAQHGADGLHLALTGDYEVIILDVMLPGADGWTVLETLRRAGKQSPVLFLTARDSVTDRVKGLKLGADDYLVKPFAFSELLARIESILRRGPTRQSDLTLVADLTIDRVRSRVTRGGHRIELTPKEFQLLSLLARRCGEILSRTILAELVWDMNFDSDSNVVDVHVRRLRAKVDDPFGRKLIHTVRGRGYILEERI